MWGHIYFRCGPGFPCLDCQCDPSCVEFGACCPDTITSYGLPKNTASIECVKQSFKTTYIGERRKVYKMVTKCPLNFRDENLKEKCEQRTMKDNILNPPVSDRNFVFTYRNKYCAECSNVFDYEPWLLRFVCYSDMYADVDLYFLETLEDFMNEIYEFPFCSLFNVKPSNKEIRQCNYYGIVSECNVTGRWKEYNEFIDVACQTYTTIFELDIFTYRNVFCAICNGEYIDDSRYFCGTEGTVSPPRINGGTSQL